MFKKILLFVERSEESLKAARVAIGLARAYGARIIATYVVDTTVVNHLANFSRKPPEEVAMELEENGWKYLYNIEEEAVAEKVKIFLDLKEGRPTNEVIESIRKFDADLLVLARQKERGTRGVKAAKAVEEILTHATCPVLIV